MFKESADWDYNYAIGGSLFFNTFLLKRFRKRLRGIFREMVNSFVNAFQSN